MRIVLLLIIGLFNLSLTSHAEETVTVIEASPGEVDITTVKTTPPTEAPVILIAPEPQSGSIPEALAAPEDPFVEGKGLNADDENTESPDEADEDGEEGEEGGDEDSEHETDVEE